MLGLPKLHLASHLQPACRRDRRIKWPNLYRMWRQFHGCPRRSAGAERLFSKAGKQHDDLKKNTSEGTLESSLMAAINTNIPVILETPTPT